MGQVFELLDHWRQRQKDQLTPLIWNPACELLADVDQLSQLDQNTQRTRTSQSHLNERDYRDRSSNSDSEEEDFAAELDKVSKGPLESSSSSQFGLPVHTGTGTLASRALTHRGINAHTSSGIRSCESYHSLHIFTIYPACYNISR